jgi:hypothetical protein
MSKYQAFHPALTIPCLQTILPALSALPACRLYPAPSFCLYNSQTIHPALTILPLFACSVCHILTLSSSILHYLPSCSNYPASPCLLCLPYLLTLSCSNLHYVPSCPNYPASPCLLCLPYLLPLSSSLYPPALTATNPCLFFVPVYPSTCLPAYQQTVPLIYLTLQPSCPN